MFVNRAFPVYATITSPCSSPTQESPLITLAAQQEMECIRANAYPDS